MKLAILCLVVLGLVALSLSAPVEQPEEVALVAGENSEAAMNELDDPNCGGEGDGASGEDGEAMQSQDGSKKGRKGKKGGKGKKKGKKPKDEASTDTETA